MSDWKDFQELDETAQAAFLLDQAGRAVPALSGHPEHRARIADYVQTAHAVLGGDVAQHAQLRRFLSDPQMTDDFNVYFNALQGDERALAALDLAAYACGFVARITAPAAGNPVLSDPILEAEPENATYFEARAALLGL